MGGHIGPSLVGWVRLPSMEHPEGRLPEGGSMGFLPKFRTGFLTRPFRNLYANGFVFGSGGRPARKMIVLSAEVSKKRHGLEVFHPGGI